MRLIDADALLLHLSDYQLQESPNWGANDYGNSDKYEAITDCIDAVESAPTVEPKQPAWVRKVEQAEELAKQNPHIRNSLAYALYHTWKEYDR